MKRIFADIFEKFISPKSDDSDSARREYILNILLCGSILMMAAGFFLHVLGEAVCPRSYAEYQNNVLSIEAVFGILAFLILLYNLSRKGFFHIASYIFLFVLLLFSAYMNFRWGADLNASLLFYVLVIIMSSILINTRFSFIMTVLSSSIIFIAGYLQVNNKFSPNTYWRSEIFNMTDIVMFVVMFFIIAAISWLSNREIEKSLMRARKSEKELKEERDLLEMKVEERTRKIEEMQAEKMVQLYRFAEFGRLSSGIFHDLINPLNALVISVEKIKDQDKSTNTINETKTYLDSAVLAARKMEDMISAVRKQITKQENNSMFSVNDEIKQVISVLAYKALKAGVEITFSSKDDIETFGDATKFNQAALNLVANAIESYMSNGTLEKTVNIRQKASVALRKDGENAVFTVCDFGAGIPEENLEKMFEPFFSTKNGNGMGIGLSMVKRIVEKDFGGLIEAESVRGRGTVFTVVFKIKKDGDRQE